jgi:5-methylcytosine-specific restriction endonuclease McrA
MSDLKRLPVKYVRDFIKKDYVYGVECFVCRSKDSLELHHLYSISELWNEWLDKYKIDSDCLTIERVMALREVFYEEHKHLLGQENLYTLCKTHHLRLHSIYGARYSNWRSEKVKSWLESQKDKFGEQNGRAL